MKKGKRNLLALLMVALLCFSELGSLTGRASDDEPENEVKVSEETAEEDHYAPVPVQAAPEPDLDLNAEEGKVLNIYTWNREFPDLVTTYYPGYTVVDDTHGKIGDVDVVWSIVPKNNVKYVNNLYSKLF